MVFARLHRGEAKAGPDGLTMGWSKRSIFGILRYPKKDVEPKIVGVLPPPPQKKSIKK